MTLPTGSGAIYETGLIGTAFGFSEDELRLEGALYISGIEGDTVWTAGIWAYVAVGFNRLINDDGLLLEEDDDPPLEAFRADNGVGALDATDGTCGSCVNVTLGCVKRGAKAVEAPGREATEDTPV